ncbi:PREDICTED: 5-hydroxytryptamine receptor 2A-like [Priapulus caudatus]|uniref:5-hydroxytryptamine receptor 2A-like n=1 Tax=Priapulus caudatus TaxID=37621 RepID=A0ABM1E218_PRICU|nr:PREDICTED: 5-hydroxytryptamine receptor 2A-like [Priapulus caudatus]
MEAVHAAADAATSAADASSADALNVGDVLATASDATSTAHTHATTDHLGGDVANVTWSAQGADHVTSLLGSHDGGAATLRNSVYDMLPFNTTFANATDDDMFTFATTFANASDDYDMFSYNATFANDSILYGYAPTTSSPQQHGFHIDWSKWPFIILSVFVLTGVIGNVLVILAILLEKKLQNVTNYFLLSLGIADLLVSAVVMPLAIITEFYDSWPFGTIVCNFYTTTDVLCCTSSIMHMCTISLDRYLGISNPLKTRNKSKRIIFAKICVVWLISFGISCPLTVLGVIDASNILLNVTVGGNDTAALTEGALPPPPTEKTIQLCMINNDFFKNIGSMIAFYVPLVIMVITYSMTVHLLRKQAKLCCDNPSEGVRLRRTFVQQSRRPRGTGRDSSLRREHSQEHLGKYTRSPSTTPEDSLDLYNPLTADPATASQQQHPHRKISKMTNIRSQLKNRASSILTARRTSLGASAVANEQKATKVLGIVFSTFVLCWSPFFTLNVISAIWGDKIKIPEILFIVSLWLGYISSTLNPLVYTTFNRTFKRAFIKILKCACWRRRRRHRWASNGRVNTVIFSASFTNYNEDSRC